jgi:hypothetical protein
MNAPMVGSWSIEVKAVKPFTIHGDLYYELHVVKTDDAAGATFAIKVPQHAADEMPQVGQRFMASFLMGQVTQLKQL